MTQAAYPLLTGAGWSAEQTAPDTYHIYEHSSPWGRRVEDRPDGLECAIAALTEPHERHLWDVMPEWDGSYWLVRSQVGNDM